MRHFKQALLLLALVLLLGCTQKDSEFRLGLFWGSEGKSDSLISSSAIITFDELIYLDVKMRLALTHRNDKLGIQPVTEVTETAVFEYYQIPTHQRTEQDGKINFGYVWVKPNGAKRGEWTNTQLWVKAEALSEEKHICHNISSDNPWTFYLSDGECDVGSFNICDENTPKLGLIYSDHYDIVLLSDTASSLGICE